MSKYDFAHIVVLYSNITAKCYHAHTSHNSIRANLTILLVFIFILRESTALSSLIHLITDYFTQHIRRKTVNKLPNTSFRFY